MNQSCNFNIMLLGLRHVVGMDFSHTVVETMQRRSVVMPAIAGRVRYFCGDARDMISEPDGSYDLAIDKGTLDAIMSDTSGGAGIISATRYLEEMWRVLTKTIGRIGRLLLLSTISPPMMSQLFDTISTSSDALLKYMWNLGESNMTILKTSEGKDIFYYSFPCNPRYVRRGVDTVRPPLASSKVAATNDSILEEIERVKKEAADAVASLKKAQHDLAKSQQLVESTERSLKKTNETVDQLKTTLDKSWNVVSEEIICENIGTNHIKCDVTSPSVSTSAAVVALAAAPLSQNISPTTSPSKAAVTNTTNWRDEEIVERRVPMPESVRLEIDLKDTASSLDVCRRLVAVRYTLTSPADTPRDRTGLFEAWDEDDSIALESICDPAVSVMVYAYAADASQPYESFEYTENPSRLPSSEHTAEAAINFPLPPYGGWFVFSYIRQITSIKENEKSGEESSEKSAESQSRFSVMRERVRLAQSAPFQLPCAMFTCRPDFVLPGGLSVRRRGGGAVKPVKTVHLRNFGMLCSQEASAGVVYSAPVIECREGSGLVSVGLHAAAVLPSHRICIARTLAWSYQETEMLLEGNGRTIVVEIDTVTIDKCSGDVLNIRTVCWAFPAPPQTLDIDVDSAMGLIGIDVSTFTLHIPSDPMSAVVVHENVSCPSHGSMFCAFCGALLLEGLSPDSSQEWVIPQLSSIIPIAAVLACYLDSISLKSRDDLLCRIYGGGQAVCLRLQEFTALPGAIFVGNCSTIGEHRNFTALTCARCWSPLGDVYKSECGDSTMNGDSFAFLNGCAVSIGDTPRPVGVAQTHPCFLLSRALREGARQSRECFLHCEDSLDCASLRIEIVDGSYCIALSSDDWDFITGAVSTLTTSEFRSGILLRCTTVSFVHASTSDEPSALNICMPSGDFMKVRMYLCNASLFMLPPRVLKESHFTSDDDSFRADTFLTFILDDK